MSETTMKERDRSSVTPADDSSSEHAQAIQIPMSGAGWGDWHDQRVNDCIRIWWETECPGLHQAVGELFSELRTSNHITTTGLSDRVARLEIASNYEERFAKLANEAKSKPEIPQDELLARIEGLQRQVDGNRVADLDARFGELAERVGELEKTNSLEARFIKLASEAKGGPEIRERELLAKIEILQRELDELKKAVAQGGPQGPSGRLDRKGLPGLPASCLAFGNMPPSMCIMKPT